ncbi:uncharacterized protein LOC114963820 isoform X2 [Acropora millepora]|uniref:uncharacterized protein LOC114963820 isoform X2 n=1 Tax=Acropora millepora TaxID=45264 RepID=UPI001CF28D20|nr:uncharacterized protein LOC114963820 isoform X2 [Acropora millepora]
MHMAADKKDPRLLLSKELEAIRSKIVREELVLFVGEQLSTLVTPENQIPSLDDWWQIVNHPSEDRFKALLDLEEGFLARHQLAQSRVHNVLRNVGKFPLIITTNMDELLEKFLWKTGNGGEKIRLDQISCLDKSWPYLRRDVVIKCLGDAGFNARVLPSSKKYFEDFCDSQENAEVEFMRQLFNERSILFLGCDPNREEYMNFFRKFAVNAKEMKHYKFETHSESDLEKNGNLLTLKANLQPWEFVQFLSTGTIEEKIQPGKVYERSYLRHQRAEYLQQQLALEKMASEIVYHTTSITNALSPDDFFEQVSLPTIQNIFTQDPFGVYSEEKVQRTMAAMKARRDNLFKMIKESKTNVTALFFYHGVKNEIELWKKEAKSEEEKQKNLKKCKISISKYAKAILLCKSFLLNKSSLEIRIVGDQDTYKVQEVDRETFALIRLQGGQDEAICYAETATSPQSRKFANHLININGEEVLNKRRIYEKSRANAWSNEDSIFKLANALLKENNEIQKQGFGISAIDKDDLKKLEALTRVSLKVRSQLDLDSFERLAAGNFGEVFKAKRKGSPVAVKILKNVENVRRIEYFEREVDLLSKAKHPNIVGVIGCLAIDNNLAIVMELVLGGNLKQFLKNDLHGAEKKEFTVRFIEHIGSAIEHLHSLDIIHRDVKPDNILLSKDHKVLKLGDFGVARATEGTEQTKTMMGSLRYMAPEVGRALLCHYSKRADVYSFGLCLIEVLSQGKVVFDHIADDEAVMARKRHGEKPQIPEISVDEFGEELATKLKGITEECLRLESSRPEMSRVLRMLRGELTAKRQKDDLEKLATLARVSLKVRSQLDLDSFERLAAGSFGEVFKAETKRNPVAVKILKNVENVKQIEYYKREVDLLSKAKHPNIVGVIGCLAIDNNLAIVMELVMGGNLKQFLKNDLHGAGKKEFTVRFVEHIGSAIEHLHSLDIIHRDVKPDNILLSEDHKVLKLGDFGIARATEGTEQTKTMMGSFRYMAPEVGMALRCHYSKRADVYSFGLCLIEVLSQGKVVFDHIADDEAVMDRKKHGEKPQFPEISVDEFGEELATKLKGITEECLRPESSRPEMSRVLRMLRGELTANKGTVELYCIGTGTGTTAVVHGKPSSSVIIYHDGKPLLLADIGAGVLKPCMEKLGHPHGAFPRNVFISHNHMDHSGELPLLLAFESMRRYKAKEPALRVLCGPEVEHKLKTHRLDELLSTSYTPEQVAEWIVCKPDGDPAYLDDAKHFFIKIYRTLHSEVCYGFLLHFKDKPILGYLVDSGFKEDVYEFFFQASTVVVDARKNGNKDHASFAKVVDYVKEHEFKRSKVYITGYGIDTEYPLEGLPEVEPLRPEQYITLWEEDMENAEH